MQFKEWLQDETLCNALDKLGWHTMMPVQQLAIPELLAHHHVVIQANTGSGKTGAYGLPILEQIKWEEKRPQSLILAPTRELAMQIKEELESLGKYKRIKCVSLIGKQPMSYQVQDLKQKTHIVTGTPGRVLDHMQNGTLQLDTISTIVLDEADEMCRMGFLDDLKAILDEAPVSANICCCSATITDEIHTLCETYAPNAVSIQVEEAKLHPQIQSDAYEVAEADKEAFLWKLLLHEQPSSAIVFCNTREQCVSVYQMIQETCKETAMLHGGMDQAERELELERFRYGKAQILVASDVASRGLDIEAVDLIINYELPIEKERFIHRSGRSGRNEHTGRVISLIGVQERMRKTMLEEYSQTTMNMLDADVIWNQPKHVDAVAQFKAQRKEKEKKSKVFQEDILRLYIHGGKKKKVRAGDLVGAICQIEGVSGDDIGVIQVQDLGSYVEILHGKGKLVWKQLQTKTIKNKQLKVEVSHKQI